MFKALSKSLGGAVVLDIPFFTDVVDIAFLYFVPYDNKPNNAKPYTGLIVLLFDVLGADSFPLVLLVIRIWNSRRPGEAWRRARRAPGQFLGWIQRAPSQAMAWS